MRKIAILGSTGSIGTQTLEVVEANPERFSVEVLTANNHVDLLIEQALKFHPDSVVIANEEKYPLLRDALQHEDIKVFAGADALAQIVTFADVDLVVTALVGYSGLIPTVNAIKAGKNIALANKETLVVAGELVNESVAEHQVAILPVDSEHSAIFQSLVGEGDNEISKLLLTCSGGPFRKFTHEQLRHVTAADALRHPTWDMGAKITIDSASLMNKGFEVIEARWLFGVSAEKIEVLIHPQSIVHSGVEFVDGGVKAQLGVPDMKLPIQYAFSYPDRLPLQGDRLDLFRQPLEFFRPDVEKFQCLQLAYESIRKGGNMPCIVNAANEIVNLAFREGRCSFLGMGEVIEKTMQRATFDAKPDYEVYLQTDAEARRLATELLTE